jgi:hypothetical protein
VDGPDRAGRQRLAAGPAAAAQLRIEAVQRLHVQTPDRDASERRDDALVDLAPVALEGGGGDLLDALAPLVPALHQVGDRPRGGATTTALGHLGLQRRLDPPSLALRLSPVVLEALLAGQRIETGVHLDLPVAVALPDHRAGLP